MSDQNLKGKDRSESESSNHDRFSPGFRVRAVSEIYSFDSPGFMIFSPDSKVFAEDSSEPKYHSPTCGEEVTAPYHPQLMHAQSEVVRGSISCTDMIRSTRSLSRARGRLFSELSISDMPIDCGEGMHFIHSFYHQIQQLRSIFNCHARMKKIWNFEGRKLPIFPKPLLKEFLFVMGMHIMKLFDDFMQFSFHLVHFSSIVPNFPDIT